MLGLALVLSLIGLALGPVLFALGRRQELTFAALDGFTLGLVPALLLLRLLPHLCEDLGPPALLLAATGFVGFWLVERRSHRAGARLQHAVLVPAMAVHSLLDGASLALAFAVTPGEAAPLLLGGALVLHRLPEGLLLTTALTPQLGFRRALHGVALIGAATVIGAAFGHAVIDAAPHALLDGFVALGVGVMLRLAVHRHSPPPVRAAARGLGGAGFLVGLAIPLLVDGPETIPRTGVAWAGAAVLAALLAARLRSSLGWLGRADNRAPCGEDVGRAARRQPTFASPSPTPPSSR